MDIGREAELARQIAAAVAERGGRAYYVGGPVRDRLLGRESKDIDMEVYGLPKDALWEALSRFGTPYDKGFGVSGLEGTELDIALPRTETRTGEKHTSFEVLPDPFLSFEQATARRDFTVNAMLEDILTGEVVDCRGGRADLEARVIRCVRPSTYIEDALRVFRAARFAARLDASVEKETRALSKGMDVTSLSRERVCVETEKAMLDAERPSIYFRELRHMGHLGEFFPELEACVGVRQNPKYHPEGDVFEHTMLVLDAAASLRTRAADPLGLMYAALCHDLGKVIATEVREDGKITAYGHETLGLGMVETQLRRVTNDPKRIRYVLNMTALHMRPNMLAQAKSKRAKTRGLFDESVCPEDLILLARADGMGKLDEPYPDSNEVFLRQRLEDYRAVLERPMVTGDDLIREGLRPGKAFAAMLKRARRLHMSGLDREKALKQVLAEYRSGAILKD